MRFILYSAPILSRWDWTASGGSEQFHIELGQRLVSRGHEVYSYAPVPWKIIREREHNGVKWNDVSRLDVTMPGVWIFQRNPDVIFRFPENHPGQTLLFSVHDFDYTITDKDGVIMKWQDRFDCILAECESHARYLRDKYRFRVVVTGAGILLDKAYKVPKVFRNPRRIMYSSSPTRGLLHLLLIFKRLREEIPDAELAVSYGWESIDAAIAGGIESSKLKKFKERTLKMLDQPGVTWLGRLKSTVDVWTEYSKSGIFCYPTQFHEIACNTVMEAQCFGAIPVVNPTWAVGDHTLHGVKIKGDPWDDRLISTYYVRELVNLMIHPEIQEEIRSEMVPDACERFNFDSTVDRIEKLARDIHLIQSYNELSGESKAEDGAEEATA